MITSIEQCTGRILKLQKRQIDKIESFVELVRKWNGLNLIAKSTEYNIYENHIYDGLSASDLFQDNEEIVDFGAGGGVIGVPLLITGLNVIFVERAASKLAFLRDIIKVNAHSEFEITTQTVLMRGVWKIADAMQKLSARKFVFFKSENVEQELAQIQEKISVKIFPRPYVQGSIVCVER